ncbi:MAG: SCO family protein [Acidimicrobiaceae bacterium]|nr:SCO family protein [Acidimicrobiaceae bacterium]
MTASKPSEGGSTASNGEGVARRRLGALRPLALIISFATVLAVGAIFLVANGPRSQTPQLIRVTGIPASVSTSLANLMALSTVPKKSAPAFALTDQRGHTISLKSFRGRPIVLEFMDPHCVDICPIISQEFIDAYHDLGSVGSRVVFMAINVNQYHAGVADVAAFSNEHRLNSIATWHFFTGPVSILRSIWRAYGITVEAPSPNADVIHSSFVFFIDAQGRERYFANPTDFHTASGAAYLPAGQLTSWGHGIALVARSLLK